MVYILNVSLLVEVVEPAVLKRNLHVGTIKETMQLFIMVDEKVGDNIIANGNFIKACHELSDDCSKVSFVESGTW